MPKRKMNLILLMGIFLGGAASYGQSADSVTDRIVHFPSRLFGKIQGKTADLDKRLTRQTEKYLEKMARREERLKKKLYKIDSTGAKTLFNQSAERYAALSRKLKNDTVGGTRPVSGEYMAYIDSLKGTLSFLDKNPQLLSSTKIDPAQLQNSLMQLQQLQAKIQDADEIKQFMHQRKEQIQQYLSKYTHLPAGLSNTYNDYNKQLYYYGQQVKEYKEMLNDPDKLFRTALVVLDKLPAFTAFMKSNSFLSGAFGIPGNSSLTGQAGQTVQGLQTRDQILSSLQSQFGANGPNAESLVRRNIQATQGQLDQLRDKVNAGGGSDLNMPGFKPNSEKTKTFSQRIEYGTNLQTAHGNYYFPTTTDLGLSVGYKLNKENRVGVGASYKIGWGNDFSHVNVSSQGAGLRSFLDIQVKKTWFASGGFEYNCQQPFTSLNAIHSLDSWQESGLLGVSKILSMKTKVFKKTRFQLLWDFLSYQQIPKAQPLKFRVGYNF